jgi:hypothetical protein
MPTIKAHIGPKKKYNTVPTVRLKEEKEKRDSKDAQRQQRKEAKKERQQIKKEQAKEHADEYDKHLENLTDEEKKNIASMFKDAATKWKGLPEEEKQKRSTMTQDERVTILTDLKEKLNKIKGVKFDYDTPGTGLVPGMLVGLMNYVGHGFGEEYNLLQNMKRENMPAYTPMADVVVSAKRKSDGAGGKRRRTRTRTKRRKQRGGRWLGRSSGPTNKKGSRKNTKKKRTKNKTKKKRTKKKRRKRRR